MSLEIIRVNITVLSSDEVTEASASKDFTTVDDAIRGLNEMRDEIDKITELTTEVE